MKVIHAVHTLALCTLTAAQGISVTTPQSGDSIPAGGAFTVNVQQPRVPGTIDQVSLLIGITPCPSGACSPSLSLGPGAVLYNGPYTPAQDPNDIGAGLHQAFSLTLPTSVPTGENILTVVHIADLQEFSQPLSPVFDYANIIVSVV